jgi:hypothetical protein
LKLVFLSIAFCKRLPEGRDIMGHPGTKEILDLTNSLGIKDQQLRLMSTPD